MSLANPDSIDCRWCTAWFEGPDRRDQYAEHLRIEHASKGSAQRDADSIENSGSRVGDPAVSSSAVMHGEAVADPLVPPSPAVLEHATPTPVPSPEEEPRMGQCTKIEGCTRGAGHKGWHAGPNARAAYRGKRGGASVSRPETPSTATVSRPVTTITNGRTSKPPSTRGTRKVRRAAGQKLARRSATSMAKPPSASPIPVLADGMLVLVSSGGVATAGRVRDGQIQVLVFGEVLSEDEAVIWLKGYKAGLVDATS